MSRSLRLRRSVQVKSVALFGYESQTRSRQKQKAHDLKQPTPLQTIAAHFERNTNHWSNNRKTVDPSTDSFLRTVQSSVAACWTTLGHVALRMRPRERGIIKGVPAGHSRSVRRRLPSLKRKLSVQLPFKNSSNLYMEVFHGTARCRAS